MTINELQSSTDHVASLKRRGFLKAGGALVVAFCLPLTGSCAESGETFPKVPPEQLDSWLAIGQDGSVTAFTGRIDMGTGVQTVFAQAVAEELDVNVNAVTVILGDTARTPEQGKSTASNNIARNLPPMRQAAAEARMTLLGLAAEKFGAPAQNLTVSDGIVSMPGSGRTLSYGELIGGGRFNVTLGVKGSGNQTKLIGHAPLKSPKHFKVLGKSVPRVDIPAKVRGEWKYVHDVVVDGMLHGTVVLPPARGMKLVSVDGFPQPVAGVVKVVTRGNFVGIVAQTEQAAVRARNSLRVTWAPVTHENYEDVYAAVDRTRIIKEIVEGNVGDVKSAFAKAANIVESTYRLPVNSHGMMGPSCAIADFRDGALTLWSGTQWPDGTRRDVAAMLGLPVDKVHLVWVQGSGSYGRLGVDDAAGDAALLAQAVGRPVRVQWQRADENQWSPFCPAAVIQVKAGLDAHGNIVAWQFENRTPGHSTAERGNILAWRALGTNPGHDRLSGGADNPSYNIPNLHVVTHYTDEVVRAIYMRSVAGIQNAFAIESHMDDLAAKAGADPVEFRLRHTANARSRHVIETVARKAGWKAMQKPVVNGDLIESRGIAAMCAGDGKLENHGAWGNLATIVDIVLDRRTGVVRVKRVFVAFDAGRIANPDGLRAQAEGGTIMGISRALKEQVLFRGGAVASADWLTYPVLQFNDVPETLEVELIDTDNPPLGAGEVPNVTPASAIGNAIFAATGVRMHELPLTPEKVKAALAAA
jgi:CO/xanthine dehydrogenase Mo-binding subunit